MTPMTQRSRPLVIIGAGGFGREVHDVIDAINEAGTQSFELLGFLDDGHPDERLIAERETQYLGNVTKIEDLADNVECVIGIGNGAVRRKIDQWVTSIGRTSATLVHPTATLGRNVAVGPGSIICAYSSITTNVRLGRHVHLNLHCTVGHDSVLGDYATAYPGAHISGDVHLEDGVSIGTGASIIQGIHVGAYAFIGAAAGVIRDIPAGVTAVGVPAKPR